MKNDTDYESAIEYYPEAFPCGSCKKPTHGIVADGMPLRICNDCAVPTETIHSGEETFYRDADGSVSLA
ncbi:hypothetical protein LCGC14_1643330 [marine sediment metagenome]|uniref:Uncharacterized protein n=1 Tax=marine sediment metagenome TaxID=412755 RepID=A0A0F9HYW2_9ZZZZ